MLEDGLVLGEVYVVVDHVYEEGRLGSVQVVVPVPVGDHPVVLDHVEVVLQDVPARVEHSRPQQGPHHPVRVPVVDLLLYESNQTISGITIQNSKFEV